MTCDVTAAFLSLPEVAWPGTPPISHMFILQVFVECMLCAGCTWT